jgi:hypothetical protein
VSILIVMGSGSRSTARTLNRVIDHRDPDWSVEVLVIANGSSAAVVADLDGHRERLPELTVVPVRAGDPIAALNHGLERARGTVVVVLSAGVELLAGWLPPLVAALDDPETLGVAPLVRAPDGTLAGAGFAFPPDAVPYPFLAGFPVEDADFLAHRPFPAVLGPAVAFRRDDLERVRGLRSELGDPLAWADASLRLAKERPGHFRVCLASSVVVRRAQPGPAPEEYRRFAELWRAALPADERQLWLDAGFEVGAGDAGSGPQLRRRPVEVREGVPRLRWAIKNPATALGWGELWGDTHFCRRLAEALRGLGQTVGIDHREAFDRPTGEFDDVTLVVRGLTPHQPTPGAVNLAWVISHPDEVGAAEAAAYDQVFAASIGWAARMSAHWGLHIEPLLQATDPALFHPDRALPDSGPAVLFIGTAREGTRALLLDAVRAGVPLCTYGLGWDELLPAERILGRYLPYEQVGAAYRSAGLVLNEHLPQMRAEGFVSNRLFDAAAAGARVVTDDVDGLASLFGRSVQVAHTGTDVLRLTTDPDPDAIFGDDTERRAVAARVHAEHSFAQRAQRLLDAALRIRADRVSA